jgi:hypothetical protein
VKGGGHVPSLPAQYLSCGETEQTTDWLIGFAHLRDDCNFKRNLRSMPELDDVDPPI